MISRELRKSRRYLLQLPIIVRWVDEDFACKEETRTQDVSSCGLRFELPKGLKSDLTIEILMTLSPGGFYGGSVQVRCIASVVRSNIKGSDKVELAAAIQRFQFIRAEPTALIPQSSSSGSERPPLLHGGPQSYLPEFGKSVKKNVRD
jgi:hypothetical protein